MSSAHPLRHARRPDRSIFARATRRSAAVAALASMALVVAGCGGGEEKERGGDEPTPTPTPTAAPEPLVSPLTGLEVDSLPRHPIVVVKIDNSRSAAPQIGLGSADLVTQELVEGGITRLAVFFDSKVPETVGPVRSMRATDIGIVQPANAVLVASGGAPQTVGRVKEAGIPTFTEGALGYFREGGRRAPYNLMMRLDELVRSLKKAKRPKTYLPFAKPDAESPLPRGRRAKVIDARYSAGTTTHWEYRRGRYVNTNTFAAEGDRFDPATVLVLRVRVGDAGYRDPAGNPVPETMFTGKGQALVFHGGRVVRGTWTKRGFGSELALKARGQELLLPPGKVWIELVPAQGGDVTFGK